MINPFKKQRKLPVTVLSGFLGNYIKVYHEF